eukprot:Colp12_sorted_trinity150504_noHs@18913
MDLLRSRLFPGAFRAAFNFAAVQMRTQVRTGYTSSKPTFRKTSPEPVILKEKLAELPLIAHARPKTLRPLQVVKGAKATSLVATLNSSIQSEEQKSLFAVVQLAGKQFKVTKNDIVVVNKLKVDVGAQIKLEKVLMLGSPSVSVIGTPLIDKEKVEVFATVIEQTREAKKIVFKKKRRKGYTRRIGHRQYITFLRINDIVVSEFTSQN